MAGTFSLRDYAGDLCVGEATVGQEAPSLFGQFSEGWYTRARCLTDLGLQGQSGLVGGNHVKGVFVYLVDLGRAFFSGARSGHRIY